MISRGTTFVVHVQVIAAILNNLLAGCCTIYMNPGKHMSPMITLDF